MNGFRFSDGAEFLGGDGSGAVSFNVTMPTDDDGFFGRECPECKQDFRIDGADIGGDWNRLIEVWAARHAYTHCDGIIDGKYLAAVPWTTLKAGQRLRITEADARSAIRGTEQLCRSLTRAPRGTNHEPTSAANREQARPESGV